MKSILNIVGALSISLIALSSCSQKDTVENDLIGKTKRNTISFAPKVTGRLEHLYVQEGDIVKKGDTLAYISVPEVDAKMAQVSGLVKAATAQHAMAQNGATPNQLKQLSAKKAALQEQYEFAQKSYNRAKAMFEDEMMTPQDFDEISAKYNGAKAQLAAVNAEWDEANKGVRIEQKTAASGQAEQALGALSEVRVAAAERYIIATNDMQIETIALQLGELVTAGYPLFNGYLPESLYFRFTVPESQIATYQPGKALKINIPYLDTEVDAQIVTIKQLNRYADITTAYPKYSVDDAIYEIKVKPTGNSKVAGILTNATVLIKN